MPLFDMQRLVDPELVRLDRKQNSKRRARSAILVILFLAFAGLLISTVYRYAAWRSGYIASLPEQRADLVSIAMTNRQNTYMMTMAQDGKVRAVEITAFVVSEGEKPDGGVRGAIVSTTGSAPGYVRFRQVDAVVPFPGLGLLKLQPGIYDLWAYTSQPFIPAK